MSKSFFLLGDGTDYGPPLLKYAPGETVSSQLAKITNISQKEVETKLIQRMDTAIQMIKNSHSPHCIVFGTGQAAHHFFQDNPKYLNYVSCFCDNNPKWDGKYFLDRPVIKPASIPADNAEWIVISTLKYYSDIRKQLVNECNVPNERIVSLGFFHYIQHPETH